MSLIAFARSEVGREEPPHDGQGQAWGLATLPSAASEAVRVKWPLLLGFRRSSAGKHSHVTKRGAEPPAPSRVVSVSVQHGGCLCCFCAKVGHRDRSRGPQVTDAMSVSWGTRSGSHRSSEHPRELQGWGLRSCCSETPAPPIPTPYPSSPSLGLHLN